MNLITRVRERAVSALPWTFRISGIIVVIIGLQTWGFYRHVVPLADTANDNLVLLQEEAASSKLINATLNSLRDYRRISNDEVRKRQILELRDTVTRSFHDKPGLAIDELVRVASGFEAGSALEQEVVSTLHRRLSRLKEIYSDHFAAVIAEYTDAPWYFQPGAAMLTMNRSTRQKLYFDHALYLTLVGDRDRANSIFNELRQSARSEGLKSRVLFAQARLQYDAFRVGKDPDYHRQAVQHVQQSLRHDATYDLPKLFLEYLLTIDRRAMEIESSPLEGQGSGEAQGERGAISTESPEH